MDGSEVIMAGRELYTRLLLEVDAPEGAASEHWQETEAAFLKIEDRLRDWLKNEFANDSTFTYRLTSAD